MNRRQVAVGFAWNFLFGLPSKLVFPVLTIIIARIIGPTEMGVFAVLTTVLSISDVIRDGGLGHSYVADRSGSDPDREAGYNSLAIVSGAVLALTVIFSRFQIATFFSQPQLAWGLLVVAAALLANGFVTIPTAKLNREARFRDLGVIQTLAALGSYAVAIPLVFSGLGFRALVWWLFVRSVLSVALSYRAAPVRIGWVGSSFLALTMKRSSAILAQNLMYSIYTILDNALIGKLFGTAALGFYSIAWSLGMKPVEFVSFPLGSTLFVAYTRQSHDPSKFASIFCRSVAAAALVTLPMFIFIGVFAREVILVLYTSKFASSIPLVQMLAAYFAFRSLGTLAGSAMVAANRAYVSVAAWLVGFLVAGTGLLLNNGPPVGRSSEGWPVRWGGLTLESTVFWITLGACAAYALTFAGALAVLKPGAQDIRRLLRGIALTIVPAAICVAIRQVPLGNVQTLLVALPLVILIQLVAIGSVIAGSPLAALTRGGIKRIWNSL